MQAIRFILGLFVFFLTLCVVLAIGLGLYLNQTFKKPLTLEQPVFVQIEQGSGLNTIAYQLETLGLVENRFYFIAAARISGAEQDLKAGEYQIESGDTLLSILNKIRDHDVYLRFLTVPEGLTSYEIVQIVRQANDFSGEISDLPAEGSLLPETYDYRMNETREGFILRMQNAMEKTIQEAIFEHCRIEIKPEDPQAKISGAIQSCTDGLIKDKNELLTLASIVEKETALSDERRAVAAVFLNRLGKNMLLQTDPTVIYALTEGKPENKGQGPIGRRLLRKDLEVDSPYNTYKYPGLPPGPIANPGHASIEAVLNPEDHDYLYFVADGTGGHAFAKTLKEHNQNVAKWRKIRAAQ